jgi:hypothetical protein
MVNLAKKIMKQITRESLGGMMSADGKQYGRMPEAEDRMNIPGRDLKGYGSSASFLVSA